MLGVAVGVHEADGDRLDLLLLDQLARHLAEAALVELLQHLAVRRHAPGDFEPEIARHQRRRRLQEEIVKVVADLAPHLQRVAEPGRGDEADLGAGALDDRVRHQGRAVHDAVEPAGVGPGFLQQPRHALGDGDAGVVRGGQSLAGEDQVAGFVDQHEIRERPPDVDADAHPLVHRPSPPLTGRSRGAPRPSSRSRS